jgi:bifunctional UDP-N-acetylglucosamine pyrophosphorylase/glucosamine-1-phosphate N-acetyltransferase
MDKIMHKDLTVIILAAGKGTRMHSDLPKVMHKVAGMSMIEHLLWTLKDFGVAEVRVVCSEELLASADFKAIQNKYNFKTAIQLDRLGTADALKCGIKEKIKTNHTMVIAGDAPLITENTFAELYQQTLSQEASVIGVGFEANNPHGYGRMVTDNEDLLQIIEEKEATKIQKEIKLCNSGLYIFKTSDLPTLLVEINNNNSLNEFYLTDVIDIANRKGLKCTYAKAQEQEVLGINDKIQLAAAERFMQNQLRRKAMLKGVTLIDPDSTYLSKDTSFGKDVTVYPNVYISAGVTIGSGSTIMPFSHIEGATIGNNCKVGPFARIRAGSDLANDVAIGNFVEIKVAKIGNGTKINHLTYVGDANIGKKTNIGAGTIFCNYDGYSKHQTMIGDETFIGSNSALVAPIAIGNRAIIGAGSVITENVEDNSLALARARQMNFHQKAELIREKKGKKNK